MSPGSDTRLEIAGAWWTRARASGWVSRGLSVVIAMGSGGGLALARWLEPSAEGHGTHTQLGLGTCSVLQATGWPCPMCGATTSWALMAHGQPLQALWSQPFGSLLFVLTVAVFGVSIAEVVQPRARWSRISRALAPWDPVIGGGALILMFLGWTWKVILMRGWLSLLG